MTKRKSSLEPLPYRRVLRFEPLEDRRMLSITVDTTADVVDFNDGVTSLREAIFAANTVLGSDTIDFDPALMASGPAKILLTQGELKITDSLTIHGPGADLLTIDASGSDPTPNVMHGDGSRIFKIDDGFSTTLRVEIDGLSLKGGDVTGSGGAIVNREDLTLELCSISGNTASTNGGAIYSRFGSLSINGSTLQANRATGSGGQVWLYTAPLVTSTISSSLMVAFPSGGQGAALYVSDGMTRVSNSTFAVNSAGGGLVYLNAGENDVTISSCTLSCISGYDIVAVHPQSLRNTIVTTNIVVGTSLSGSFNADYCLISKAGTATINGSNNIIGQSSGIAPLADYGGPTQMYGLVADSPAVNAGDPAAMAGVGDTPLFDQRGGNYSRVVGERIDIGAYEWQNTGAPISLVVDTTSDELDYDVSAGHLSLREAISLANANAGFADAITFVPSLDAGKIMLIRGTLQIAESVTIDASALPNGVTIDASGSDPTPGVRDGKGSRVSYFGGQDLMSKQGTLNLIGLTLTGADTYSDGGAISTLGNLLVRGCTITGNSAGSGGGISVYSRADVSVQIENTTISNNRTTGGLDGGGLYLVANNGHIEVSNCYVINNHATDDGGGIFANPRNAGSIQIENSVVANNGVDLVYYDGREGGGIYASIEGPASFNIANSKVSGNILTGQTVTGGGGVYIENRGGTARIEGTLIQDNRVITTSVLSPESGDGGGLRIHNGKGSTFTISSSTVAGNAASGRAGGVYISQSQDAIGVTVSNCTISGNSANGDGGGMSISTYNSGAASLSISHCTVAGNTSDANGNGKGAGGGIFLFGNAFSPTLNNSAISGNIDRTSTAPDLRNYGFATRFTAQFSLIGSNKGSGLTEAPAGAPDANGNLIGGPVHGVIDPMLGPLSYNGGPVLLDGGKMLTMVPLPGSAVINAGDPAAVAGVAGVPASDGRRAPFTRIFGGRIDMGAVEVESAGFLAGDYNGNGIVDAADYTLWRDTSGGSVTAATGADGNGDGAVNTLDYNVWKTNFGQALPAVPVGSAAASITALPLAGAVAIEPVAVASPIRNNVAMTPSRVTLGPTRDDALLAWLAESTNGRAGPNTIARTLPRRFDSPDPASDAPNAVDDVFAALAVG